MRIIEQIDKYTFKEVRFIRHEARTWSAKHDEKLKEILKGIAQPVIIQPFLPNSRFFEIWVHPKNEEKYQELIKNKIEGIRFIE